MRKIVRGTVFSPGVTRQVNSRPALSFGAGSPFKRVRKPGERLIKRKKHRGVITILDNILGSVRQYLNRHICLILKYSYADMETMDVAAIHTMEKTLLFVIMQIAHYIQEDTWLAISIRYEEQFINIRIQNCRLRHNTQRGNRFFKIISVMQQWIKSQNGYSGYIIDKWHRFNFNIYLLRM